ncbi:MAG: patatin-like phospholipase family protein [Candidatus Obscuribacterales bacterium]
MIFEIGLVLSGTVSAGPYTAGVIDYLIEALDAWYEAKRTGCSDIPTHNVLVRVVVGTSGGAMTASLLPGALYGDFQHFAQRSSALVTNSNNRLYWSWVEDIDMTDLLQRSDLNATENVCSVFDSTKIENIVDQIFDVDRLGKARPQPDWLDTELDIYIMVTDLTGVPYAIDMNGAALGMRSHGSFLHFVLSPNLAPQSPRPYWLADTIWLNTALLRGSSPASNSQAGRQLKNAALASGAFPIGLKSRDLTVSRSHYFSLPWMVPVSPEEGCIVVRTIPPVKAWRTSEADYTFTAVDGGIVNNSAVEFARLSLRGSGMGRNPRFADQADKALIMITPFARQSSPDVRPSDIFSIAKAVVVAMLDQSRFKIDELRLALDEDVYSRFIISPSYSDRRGNTRRWPIYGELVGAFGAFVHKTFRKHDYLLGRRNCQQFLRNHFVLPSKHALFAGLSEEMKLRHAADVDEANGQPLLRSYTHSSRPDGPKEADYFVQVIPVINQTEEPLPADFRVNPLAVVNWQGLEQAIGQRLDAVVQALVKQKLGGVKSALLRMVLWVPLSVVRARVVATIINWLKREYSKFDL